MGWKPWVCGSSTPTSSPTHIRNISSPKISDPSPTHRAPPTSANFPPSPSHNHLKTEINLHTKTNSNNTAMTTTTKNPVIEHVQFDQRKLATPVSTIKSPITTTSSSPIKSSSTSTSESTLPIRTSHSRFESFAPNPPTVDYFKRRNEAIHKRGLSSGTPAARYDSPSIADTTVVKPIHSNSSSVCKAEADNYFDDVSRKSSQTYYL